MGDYLLKKTGDALLDQFGAEHSYRYGGDEFLVIYPDISEEEFRASTKKLGEQYIIKGHDGRIWHLEDKH